MSATWTPADSLRASSGRLAGSSASGAMPLGAWQPPAPGRHPAPAALPRIVLFDAAALAPGIKLRTMLGWKGLPFETAEPARRGLWPTLARRGAATTPTLDIDGRLLSHPAAIVDELDRLVPARLLRPAGGRIAALCHGIEQWADLGLGAGGQPERWSDPRHQRELQRHLVMVNNLLADASCVLGDTPWSCDFALFAQLTVLRQGRAGEEALRRHPRLLPYLDRLRSLALPEAAPQAA